MAATNYSKHVHHNARREGVLSRDEYQLRARELAHRGEALPQSKLQAQDVIDIRSAHKQRVKLLQYIRDNLSNAAIAKKHGVHVSNIEKIVSYGSWGHIA